MMTYDEKRTRQFVREFLIVMKRRDVSRADVIRFLDEEDVDSGKQSTGDTVNTQSFE